MFKPARFRVYCLKLPEEDKGSCTRNNSAAGPEDDVNVSRNASAPTIQPEACCPGICLSNQQENKLEMSDQPSHAHKKQYDNINAEVTCNWPNMVEQRVGS